MVLASPAEQRLAHRGFHQKIALAAAQLTSIVNDPEPVTVAVAIEPEAMPAETDPPPVLAYPSVSKIKAEVSAYFGVSLLDLISHRRTKDVVLPRQIAMYLCRYLTPHSLPMIGRHFGNRDHTTGLHAVRKVSALMRDDITVAQHVAHLFNVITGEPQ